MKKMMMLGTIGLLGLSLQSAIAKPVGEFAVANRGGSVSFFEYDSNYETVAGELSATNDLNTTSVSEPMYISPLGTAKGQRLLAFADRTQNLLKVINANTKKVLSQVELSKGAFHQFSHPLVGLKVAVATDGDKGMDLIEVKKDGHKLTKRHFTLPSKLSSGNPHDVVMDRNFAYLSVKGVKGDKDKDSKFDILLQISLKSLKVVRAKKFSEDIHLFNPVKAGFFVVVEEATGDLSLIQKGSMKTIAKKKVAQGVHGVTGSENGQFLFATDINEKAGSPAVYALQVTNKGLMICDKAALNFGTAHNIAVDDRSGEMTLVVTHSGGSQVQNSILTFSKKERKLNLTKELRSGVNPFGLTFF